MRASKRTALVLFATLAAVTDASVSAHRLDEFLQAARIAVDRDQVRLEMILTPGAAVADAVIGEIDGDRDGVLSEHERQMFIGRVLGAATLRVDDSAPLRMRPVESSFPDVAALRAGDAAIVVRAQASVSPLAAGSHHLMFRNENATDSAVYLANALVPDTEDVAVTGQQRTADQSTLTIDFLVRETSAASGQWVWLGIVGLFVLVALRR